MLFYLLAYAVSNLGALGIVALLGTAQHEHDELRDFAGLSKSRPGLAALMTVFLLSLGGFPPMAGFIGKWYIFSAAVERGHYWLAIIGVLTSVVSVFFYLRIVVMMYMTEGSRHRASASAAPGGRRPGARDSGSVLPRRAASESHRAGARFDFDDFLICVPGGCLAAAKSFSPQRSPSNAEPLNLFTLRTLAHLCGEQALGQCRL